MNDNKINSANAILNAVWLYGEKIATMSMQLLINVVIAREFGPSDYGLFNMLLAFVALFAPFIALGLNAIVTRELLTKPELEGKIIGTVLFLRAFGMLIGSAAILVLGSWLVDSIQPHLLFVFILLLGNSFSVFLVLDHWLQSRMESKFAATIRTISLALFGAGKIVVAIWHQDLFLLFVIQALEWIFVGVCFFGVYLKRRKSSQFLGIDLGYGFGLLKESVWLIFSGIAAVIYLKIDQIMLGSMVGQEEVGVYSVAVKLSEIWYFFPIALAASFFPKLIKDKKTNPIMYEKMLQGLIDLVFVFSLIVVTFTLAFSWFFVPFIFGAEYQRSASLLNIQIWACCFVFMRAITSKWLIAESMVKFSLLSQGTGAILNVVLNLYLIPLYQAEGAAWATLLSYFFASYLCFWIFPSTRTVALKMTLAVVGIFRMKDFYYQLKKLR